MIPMITESICPRCGGSINRILEEFTYHDLDERPWRPIHLGCAEKKMIPMITEPICPSCDEPIEANQERAYHEERVFHSNHVPSMQEENQNQR